MNAVSLILLSGFQIHGCPRRDRRVNTVSFLCHFVFFVAVLSSPLSRLDPPTLIGGIGLRRKSIRGIA